MTNKPLTPPMPFVWPEPRVSAGFTQYASALPFEAVARTALSVFGVVSAMAFIDKKFFDLSSTSALTGGGSIVLGAVVLLCIDIIKTALFAHGSVAEQLLSIALLIACSIQVVIWPVVRTEWYVLLLALQATDVVASLVVSLQANGKDVYVNR
jgi:hypothetical protein